MTVTDLALHYRVQQLVFGAPSADKIVPNQDRLRVEQRSSVVTATGCNIDTIRIKSPCILSYYSYKLWADPTYDTQVAEEVLDSGKSPHDHGVSILPVLLHLCGSRQQIGHHWVNKHPAMPWRKEVQLDLKPSLFRFVHRSIFPRFLRYEHPKSGREYEQPQRGYWRTPRTDSISLLLSSLHERPTPWILCSSGQLQKTNRRSTDCTFL